MLYFAIPGGGASSGQYAPSYSGYSGVPGRAGQNGRKASAYGGDGELHFFFYKKNTFIRA